MIIPIVSAICYLIGGQWWKPARWFLGVPIAYIVGLKTQSVWPILCVLTYWGALSCFPYGCKSWLNPLGEWVKFAICGLVFGLASFPVLGLWAIAQGIVAMVSFLVIKYLDDKGIIGNPWVELLRGLTGTVLYICL